MFLLSLLCAILCVMFQVSNFQLIQHIFYHHFVQYAKYIIYGAVHVRYRLVLKIFHLFMQLLQSGS